MIGGGLGEAAQSRARAFPPPRERRGRGERKAYSAWIPSFFTSAPQ